MVDEFTSRVQGSNSTSASFFFMATLHHYLVYDILAKPFLRDRFKIIKIK